MCPGMRPATGWIGVVDVDATRLEDLAELADSMLRLRDGQAVAGHDDDALRIGELDGRVVDADLADRRAALGARLGLRALTAAEAADEDVHQRTVHRVGHELGQDPAGRSDEGARDDEQRALEHEARHRRCGPGEAVQQADDDRHVRPADRQDHRDAERQRRAEDDEQKDRLDLAADREDGRFTGAEHEQDGRDERDEPEDRGRQRAARHRDGLAADEALELARGDERAGEGDAADEDAEDDEDRGRDLLLGRADDVEVVEDRDERRRTAADRVEQRDELRHRGHRDTQGEQQAGGSTDEPAREDDDEALGRQAAGPQDQAGERGDDRDRHADRRDAVARARRGRAVHVVQADDERRRRPEADQDEDRVQPFLRHGLGLLRRVGGLGGAVGRFLNIWSIRSVTT